MLSSCQPWVCQDATRVLPGWQLISILNLYTIIVYRFKMEMSYQPGKTPDYANDGGPGAVRLLCTECSKKWNTFGKNSSVLTSRSDYCYLNKGECNLNQLKDDSFVERLAKNNNWNNGDRHKIHEIFLVNCFVFVITLVWKTVHSSAMTQIKAHLMEKHCN